MNNIIKDHIDYSKENPNNFWFKRKLYGWGWFPVTWQGWLVILVYILLIFLFSQTIDADSSSSEFFFTFLLPTILLTIVLIRICYRTGEPPVWQWGMSKIKKENKQKILDFLQSNEKITNNDVEKLTGMSDATATRYLEELEKEQKIIQIGTTGHTVHYHLKP